MLLTKWHAVEGIILIGFIASLFLLYQLMVDANTGTLEIENAFKPGTLSGALYFALAEPGTLVRSKDFNFAQSGAVTAGRILLGSNLGLLPEQLCLSLGEASGEPGFSGGARSGEPEVIRYSPGSSAFYLSALCTNAESLLFKIGENMDISFRRPFFENCPCLKTPGEVCCAVALGKAVEEE